MSRRQMTETGILQALEAVILEQGMKGLGINAVGKQAGVSTELIYRYFDGLPGLMMAWMQGQDFWTRKLDGPVGIDGTDKTPAELVETMLRGQVDLLRDNPALAEIRRWEMVERTEIGQALANRREKTARGFVDRLDQAVPGADLPAHVAIMLAGVLYLSLRSKTESHFLGLAIGEDGDWDRIWDALRHQLAHLPGCAPGQTLGALERDCEPRTSRGADEDDKTNRGKTEP